MIEASIAIEQDTVQKDGRERLAALCKAAGDGLRLDILRVVRKDTYGVVELAFIFAMAQPGMSHHLKILATAGLLESRRQGNSIFYRRPLISEQTQFYTLIRSIFAAVDSLPLADELQQRIEAVYEERSQRSQLFFAKHAKEFSERHGQLCELSQYLGNMRQLLDMMNLDRACKVMEVGPGQGLFLAELSQRFAQVIALDSSEEMLGLAQNEMIGKSTQIQFIKNSLESFVRPQAEFHAIVLNMVLHHTPSPEAVFQRLSQLLLPGGFLLIADLCAHSQAWTKEVCGDLWLGFDPEELDVWGAESGFSVVQSLYLGLKNGFQIQLKVLQRNKELRNLALT